MAILVVAPVDAGSYRFKSAPIASDKALDGKGVSLSLPLPLLTVGDTVDCVSNCKYSAPGQ